MAIVLAAGKGTRMQSDLPKVLHRLHGRPLVLYPLEAAIGAGATRIIVVVGHGGAEVRASIAEFTKCDARVAFAEQRQQLGTGHAVLCTLDAFRGSKGPVWILSGDVPLIRTETLTALLEAWRASAAGLALAIFRPEDLQGYGRILRDAAGHVVSIREQRDASPEELLIDECNAGIYCVSAELLESVLPSLGRSNAQGEIYLTDLVSAAARRGAVGEVTIDGIEAAGVNTIEQLEALETMTSPTPSS